MRADARDYQAIIDLAEECFPRDRELGGMVPRWGHCFRKDSIQNSLIIKDGDEVVSHVGCIDQSVMVDSGTIRVSGISSVSTKPSYRGRGLMTKLLKESTRFMRDQGYVLSDLGGDRVRYRRFGWERAGRNCQYIITKRSLSAQNEHDGFQVEGLSGTRREMSDTLALHQGDGFGLVRDEPLHDILLHRLGNVTLIAWRGDSIDAYAVANIDDEKSICIGELAGGAGGISGIVHHLSLRNPETIIVPMPFQHPLNSSIRALSSSWTIQTWRMLKILDLKGILEGFSGQIESRISRLDPIGERSIRLCIKGEETYVELDLGPDGVNVEGGKGCKDAVVLSEQDMVLLLFGPCNPGLYSSLPPFVETIFPLDFYLWKNETV